MLKRSKKSTLVAVAAGLLAAPLASNAALDFSGITGAVDATTVVAAITAVAALKVLPGVARWGYNKLISWFR
ncbi:hypothetical protein [Methylovulum psychrotolerans]|uniref:Phage coat protein n=1 Tax=Methylovulum psychrotolerans TaxID=1704499 RepID=A0A1Z4C479_9GAMM|nr:hypothetical protein [Methylovulum psychrotolerans]ASF48333.1 hypothetical protein CEK71_20955 [Methylovulum psychrotolerans]MBT9097760.1 hypothetical protein [Methylovulum psychrotolerans]